MVSAQHYYGTRVTISRRWSQHSIMDTVPGECSGVAVHVDDMWRIRTAIYVKPFSVKVSILALAGEPCRHYLIDDFIIEARSDQSCGHLAEFIS